MTAGLWLFLLRLLTRYLGSKPVVEPAPQDPEILLQQAQQQMREVQAKNRERAVQAITQKNILQAKRDSLNRTVMGLRERAKTAAATGNREEEGRLLDEAEGYLPTVVRVNKALEWAEQATQLIKDAIRRGELHIHDKTAQAMAMRAAWKQEQISASIEQLSAPAPPGPVSPQAKLDSVLRQVEATREALRQEAEAALKAENYTVAIRLLAEQQNLEHAISFGRGRL